MGFLRYFIICCGLGYLFAPIFAQNNVGIGTTNPNPKAKLEVYSTNSGFLLPRLTTPQRLALIPNASSDEGLMVYDLTDHHLYLWDGTQWQPIPDLDWVIAGVNQYSGVAGNVGIGTAVPTAKLHTQGSLRFQGLLSALDNEVLVTDALGNIGYRSLPANIWDGDQYNDADSVPTNELNTTFLYDPLTATLTITDAGGSLSATLSNLGIQNIIAGGGLSGSMVGGIYTLDVNAANGLHVDLVSDEVKLGGNLVENTLIDLNTYDLIQNLNGASQWQIQNAGQPTVVVDNNANIGINTAAPLANAIVDINSTTKGILVPRMTTPQRNAIVTPPLGLIIYNISDAVAQHWNGSCWLSMYQSDCDACNFSISLSDTLGVIDKILTDSVGTVITVTQTSGIPTTISLFYLQNLPVGATAALSSYIISGTGSAVLSVEANVFATPGTYPIAIQAICGSTIKIKTYQVQIDSCFKVVINNTFTDYNLQQINAVLPTNVPICVIVDVQQNAKLYGNNNAAYNTGGLHPLSHVGFINAGEIYGKGGNGAGLNTSFSAVGNPGFPGGNAINLTTRTSIINNGYVFGGGGGGASVGVGFNVPIVGTVGVGVGGGGGAPNGVGGVINFAILGDNGDNGTGGLLGAGGSGGVLNVPIPIPLGPVSLSLTPNAYGGNGGNYGFQGTSGALSVSVAVTLPFVGTVNLGTYPNPPYTNLPPGGIGGWVIKRNNNILLGLPDGNYQNFQLRGIVGP